jgi:hypothetical protein
MQGLNKNLTDNPYCKKKKTIQGVYQEATTWTSMKRQQMGKMTRKEFAQKFNNKIDSYHSVGT